MTDGAGLAEAMLGLDGFRILEVVEDPDELVITIESTTEVAGCVRCGTRAVPHERRAVDVRDLACFGRPVRVGGAEAPLAVCRAGLWGQDLDRAASRTAGKGADDASGRFRSGQAGR